jgi:glycosyltransferase involved in cell wall biosynthesis
MRAQLDIAPGRFVVGAVGRLVSGKRMDLMLRALHHLPGVTAVIVGEGPERPALTALAAELEIDAVFPGESTEVPAMLSAMDLLVASSAEETFGLAIVEALAAGLPVLYAASPALDELPSGSAPGAHRLPPDPDAIRAAIATAVQQGPLRRPPPPALDRFDMARVAERIDAVYRRVSAGRKTTIRFRSIGR